MIIKTLTEVKWFLNGDKPATGKEVSVQYAPDQGVVNWWVNAIQRGQDGKPDQTIDISQAEGEMNNFDQHVEGFADWAAKYRTQESTHSDRFWNMAKDLVKDQARTMRH